MDLKGPLINDIDLNTHQFLSHWQPGRNQNLLQYIMIASMQAVYLALVSSLDIYTFGLAYTAIKIFILQTTVTLIE